MKEQIIQTEPNQVNTERERYGRPIRASVGRLRGRNGLHPLDSEGLPSLTRRTVTHPHPQGRRTAHGKGVADSVGGIQHESSEENYFAKIRHSLIQGLRTGVLSR